MEKPFTIIDSGSIVTIFPRRPDVWEWFQDNVDIQDYMYVGNFGFRVERRHAADIMEAIVEVFGW